MRHELELGDVESLVRFYADDAAIDSMGPGANRDLAGPIGLREGLERIVAAELAHELRLVAVHYTGSYIIDRCHHPDTGTTVAWAALTIRGASSLVAPTPRHGERG